MIALEDASARRRVVLVSGLSGAGRSSILRALEDLGYEAVDNPPLHLIGELAARAEGKLAIGVDARARDFDAGTLLRILGRLRADPALRPELVFAHAEESVLLRRYTQTRRRHPLAPLGRVVDGIAAEQKMTGALLAAADLPVDTSELPLPALRRMIETRFGDEAAAGSLSVSLISFAYPAGLPREADMVFDARFLRNPHYDPELCNKTGLEPEVAAYVEADPDFRAFFSTLEELLRLVLPRFVQEGKKYATICIGCTGGQHRSVRLVAKLAGELAQQGWRVAVTHRELGREAALPDAQSSDTPLSGPPSRTRHGLAWQMQAPLQVQEA